MIGYDGGMLCRNGILCVVLAACSACGRSGPKMVPVSGTVTFVGKPVEKGEILFQPGEPGIAPDGGAIENGAFAFKAKVGKRTVQIRASRAIKMTDMGPLMEQFIPAKYNANSDLVQEVKESGSNRFTFDLKK